MFDPTRILPYDLRPDRPRPWTAGRPQPHPRQPEHSASSRLGRARTLGR